MIVISDGSAARRRAVDAAGERDDLERVLDDGRPEPEAVPRLVEGRREAGVHVEMAGLDRQVGRLERAAAPPGG